MERLQRESRDGIDPNTNDHEYKPTGNDCDTHSTASCEPGERKLWDPKGLVMCRSCGESDWLQSFFGYSPTGINISALLCRECFDLAVVRHVKYAMPQFITAAYYVATRSVAGDARYELWGPDHKYTTMASLATFVRVQPKLPPGFRKGKLWNG